MGTNTQGQQGKQPGQAMGQQGQKAVLFLCPRGDARAGVRADPEDKGRGRRMSSQHGRHRAWAEAAPSGDGRPRPPAQGTAESEPGSGAAGLARPRLT